MLSATSITVPDPKRSHFTNIWLAISTMRSNIDRTPSGPKAGIRRRCAFAQLGSLLYAVKRPSPAKARISFNGPWMRFWKRVSSESSLTSSCELTTYMSLPKMVSLKIGP